MALPDYDDALTTCLAEVPAQPVESVGLSEAAGRILRRDLVADRDQPPFDRATMDGFAVVGGSALQAVAAWPIGATVSAGEPPPGGAGALAPGTVARIATGAPMIRGADAVVPIEQTRVVAEGSDPRVAFEIAAVAAGSNVHPRGSDARAGGVVLASGTRLGPRHVGIAAAVGAATVAVSRRPVVSILTSGDEVVAPATATRSLRPEQIRNSNGPLVTAMLPWIGATAGRIEHVRDDRGATLEAATRCLRSSDLVVSTGGVSAGHRDWLAWAWNELGVKFLVRGAAIQPGKPIVVGRASSDRGTWVVGLPGNPVSVTVTAHLFLRPILRRMLGARETLRWRPIELASPLPCRASRQLFRAVACGADGRAEPLPWHGSGDLMHLATADGVVRLPRRDGEAEAGDTVPYLSFAC